MNKDNTSIIFCNEKDVENSYLDNNGIIKYWACKNRTVSYPDGFMFIYINYKIPFIEQN